MPSTDVVKDVLNGFAGRVILMLLTLVTSIFSAVGTVYIKSLNSDLSSIKSDVSGLSINAQLTDTKKLNIDNYNSEQMLMRERLHLMDTRMIKVEEAMKNTSDSLSRIERKLADKTAQQ